MLRKMLMQIIDSLRPRAAHILIVERDDGHTFLDSTFNAPGSIARLNGAGLLIHRWQVVDTAHAEDIVRLVGHQFELHRRDVFGPWFAADYDAVLRVLNDYDTATGKRWRDERYTIGSRVRVEGAGKGKLTGFRGRHLIVTLDSPAGGAHQVIAPHTLVKPVLRPIPDSAMPAAPAA